MESFSRSSSQSSNQHLIIADIPSLGMPRKSPRMHLPSGNNAGPCNAPNHCPPFNLPDSSLTSLTRKLLLKKFEQPEHRSKNSEQIKRPRLRYSWTQSSQSGHYSNTALRETLQQALNWIWPKTHMPQLLANQTQVDCGAVLKNERQVNSNPSDANDCNAAAILSVNSAIREKQHCDGSLAIPGRSQYATSPQATVAANKDTKRTKRHLSKSSKGLQKAVRYTLEIAKHAQNNSGHRHGPPAGRPTSSSDHQNQSVTQNICRPHRDSFRITSNSFEKDRIAMLSHAHSKCNGTGPISPGNFKDTNAIQMKKKSQIPKLPPLFHQGISNTSQSSGEEFLTIMQCKRESAVNAITRPTVKDNPKTLAIPVIRSPMELGNRRQLAVSRQTALFNRQMVSANRENLRKVSQINLNLSKVRYGGINRKVQSSSHNHHGTVPQCNRKKIDGNHKKPLYKQTPVPNAIGQRLNSSAKNRKPATPPFYNNVPASGSLEGRKIEKPNKKAKSNNPHFKQPIWRF